MNKQQITKMVNSSQCSKSPMTSASRTGTTPLEKNDPSIKKLC